MNIRRSYELFVTGQILLFALIGFFVYRSLQLDRDLVRKEQHRYRSLQLGMELFQSSEDLTRMARSYVTTGNPVYEQNYYTILDIRNGRRPRPPDYTVTYWHLAGQSLPHKSHAVAPEETIALRDLMRREGFTENEFSLLGQAQSNSDYLVKMEQEAFAAVKGLFDDGHGQLTATRAPDRQYAITLLFSDQYVHEKARIMAPIHQFMDELAVRTRAEVSASRFQLQQYIILALVFVLIAVVGMALKFAHTFRMILNPIERLRKKVAEVAAGNYAARCEVAAANEMGELCAHFNSMAGSLEADMLARERSAAILKKSEEQVRLLLNSTAEAIYGIDLKGDCTFANPSCAKMLGYQDPRELIGKNMHRLIHHSYPDGKPMPVELCRIYQAFRQGQGTHVDDEVLWKADGTSLAAEYWAYPQLTDGKVTGAVVAFIDITRRKQAEAALAQARDNLQAILEHMPFGIVIIGRDRQIRWANQTACRLAGVQSPADLQSQPCGEYLCPAQQHACPILDQKQTVDNSERMLRRKDGQLIPVIKTVIEIRLQGEDVLLEAFMDITRRKQAEQALAAERQRLAYILEGTNVGTWEWNVQTGQTTFNERWAEMIGYTLAELAPISIETWTKHAHPDDLKASGALLEKHFRKELSYYECESRMRHKDGSWIWVLDRGRVATWTPEGKPLVMSGTHQDITVRKVAQERLDYMQRIFLHDITNTAVALRGFADLMRAGSVDPEMAKNFLPSVSSLSQRIIDEISAHRQLLAAEAHNLVVKKETIHSLSVLTDLFNTYNRPDILERRELKMDAAAESVDFLCDHTLLSRVLGNMIKNAIEASRPGDRITLGCFAKDQRIHFWVHNPAYIPADIQAQIFSRSFSTKGAGRGLGTYSMKILTEQYLQGRVAFVSTEDQGTTFTAEYPML